MKDYIAVIAAVIAGVFAVVPVLITWRLKRSSNERARVMAFEKEKRDELKTLYANTFALFENAILQITRNAEFTLGEEFTKNNAKIHLLAPANIVAQYCKVADLLESWSRLYSKATPSHTKVGDMTLTVFTPLTAAKYKESACAEYQRIQTELDELVDLMRAELK